MSQAYNAYLVSQDHRFRMRVVSIVNKSAMAVQSESYGGVDEPTAAEHALRVAWANTAVKDDAEAARMTRAVTMLGSIPGDIDARIAAGDTPAEAGDSIVDSTIEFAVNSIWNLFSGVE